MMYSWVLSAYRWWRILWFCKSVVSGAMYALNSSGPRTVPCGTPVVMMFASIRHSVLVRHMSDHTSKMSARRGRPQITRIQTTVAAVLHGRWCRKPHLDQVARGAHSGDCQSNGRCRCVSARVRFRTMVRTVRTLINPTNTVLLHEMLYLCATKRSVVFATNVMLDIGR